ncbi:MAG: histidine kinase N-terminal 7TM domain-containing protein, partial [Candidatus Pacebacteria bacterium]|nr:histidine kinase N-terminal 7TM domain-containing protein [Candidatus Paceibacterota bacterium]
MNAFAISGLFVGIPSVVVGIFTLLKGRNKIHLIWTAFSFSIAIWGFGIYKIATTLDKNNAIFWWRIAEIGVIFIPIFLVHFVISFLELKRKVFLTLFYILTAIFLYLNISTDYFINELYFAFNQFYYILATPIYTAFICVFIASVIYILFELGKAYKKNTGIIRNQIKYLILAFLIGFSGGLTSYPPVYRINIYPVWNAAIFISALMVAYAILRYRLMDIRIVVRKFVIYLSMAGFTYGMFYLLIWVFSKLFGSIYTPATYLSGVIIAPLFVAIFYWLNKRIQVFANKYLFYSLYNYQETITKLTDELNYYIDLDKIVNSIVNTIKQTMQLDRAGVLLINQNKTPIHYQIAKVVGFNEYNGISLVQDNFLTRHLQRTQKPLVRDELILLVKDTKNLEEKESFKQLHKNMIQIEASICIPLVSSSRLIGIIVLGSKVSQDAYTKEDLELLSTLSKQAAIAVDNAVLYKQIQDLNKNLQAKVDEQTKEIRNAYEIEKKARQELERLDKAKNQFILA